MRGSSVGCAVCVNQVVPPHSSRECEFSLVWSMPQITFGNKKLYYTRYSVNAAMSHVKCIYFQY